MNVIKNLSFSYDIIKELLNLKLSFILYFYQFNLTFNKLPIYNTPILFKSSECFYISLIRKLKSNFLFIVNVL